MRRYPNHFWRVEFRAPTQGLPRPTNVRRNTKGHLSQGCDARFGVGEIARE
jgi:hypothetical protein